jgi:hypothetical protein
VLPSIGEKTRQTKKTRVDYEPTLVELQRFIRNSFAHYYDNGYRDFKCHYQESYDTFPYYWKALARHLVQTRTDLLTPVKDELQNMYSAEFATKNHQEKVEIHRQKIITSRNYRQ